MSMIIGVTGGVSTGKTTVAKMLKKLSNGVLLDADKIARELMLSKTINGKVAKAFPSAVGINGIVNRTKLAGIVFSDKNELKKLNSIVHPYVEEEINRRIKESKGRIVIIDAPLLIEAGMHKMVDKLVVVSASRKTQLKRLGKSEDVKRIQSQMSMKEKVKYADFVINNSKSLSYAESQTRDVWLELSK